MTAPKTLAAFALAAALLTPAAAAGNREQAWLPRAMPSDYAAAQGSLPRAMPSDYAAAGVPAVRQAGMPRALPSDYARYFASTRVETRGGFGLDWASAGIGAAGTLGLLLLALAGARLMRRGLRPTAA